MSNNNIGQHKVYILDCDGRKIIPEAIVIILYYMANTTVVYYNEAGNLYILEVYI